MRIMQTGTPGRSRRWLLLAALAPAPLLAGTPDCSGGSIGGLLTADMTLSGNVCLTSSLSVRSRLVIEPGTRVSICSDCAISISSAGTMGTLVAQGTVAAPIVLERADPGAAWRYLRLNAPVSPDTVLRHVVLDGAGSRDVDGEGALTINESLGHDAGVPVVDHVAIDGSGNHGLWLAMRGDDPSPPSLTHLRISGSARAAARVSALGVGALGEGLVFSGNATDRIEVLGGQVYVPLRFRNHGYAYELLGSIAVRDLDHGEPNRVSIAAGTRMLLHPDVSLHIGTLGNANVALDVDGTVDDPVVFTAALGAAAPWGTIRFDSEAGFPTTSRLSHAVVEFGGFAVHPGSRDAAISHLGRGQVTLDHVEVRGSANAGIHVDQGTLRVIDSRILDNRIGLSSVRSSSMLRRSVFSGNVEAAVLNLDPVRHCVDAIGNFWGAPSGPDDASVDADACFHAAGHAGSGQAVSDGVLYRPYFTAAGAAPAGHGSISPEPWWVVANGADETLVTITLRDAEGVPLPGREVLLDSTVGTVVQPLSPTDGEGRAFARVRSTSQGLATLSARNVTDGVDVAAIGGVTFWEGSGDGLGLVEAGGTPYAAPQLQVQGRPFEAGFPVRFELPMRNTNTAALDVEVSYAVTGAGVSPLFAGVGSVSRTLAPGASWDAALDWFPPSSGHRCVQATLVVDGAPAAKGTIEFPRLRLNFDVPDDPCDALDVESLIPGKTGIGGVARHVVAGIIQAWLIRECLREKLVFRRATKGGEGVRSYEEAVIPTVYSPPPLAAGAGVTLAEAEAATALVEVAALLSALGEARAEASARVRAAGQAQADAAALRQLAAYRGFQLDYADGLELLAAAVDELLAAAEAAGSPDTVFSPVDMAQYRQDLQASGYDQATIDFHIDSGRSTGQIAQMLERDLARRAAMPELTTTLHGFLRVLRARALVAAATLRELYQAPALALAKGEGSGTALPAQLPLQAMTVDIEVGHASASTRTVELVVRPVQVPIGWGYGLSERAPSLAPGETTTVVLTLEPNDTLVQGGRVRLAVEGYVDGVRVGGLMVEKSFPPLRIFRGGFEQPGG